MKQCKHVKSAQRQMQHRPLGPRRDFDLNHAIRATARIAPVHRVPIRSPKRKAASRSSSGILRYLRRLQRASTRE